MRDISKLQDNRENTFQVVRQQHLADNVVFVDGQPGCGKSLFSAIVASLDRAELLTYAYEIEYICSLYYLGKIASDAADTMVRMLTDLQLYNAMMSREINFRFSDVSSIFRDAKPLRYIKRLFQKVDEAVPARIKKQKPILNLTTHNLLGISEPVFSALGNRVVFIEVVRHPLYMIRQQALNMERLLSNVRYFTVNFQYKSKDVPFWTLGWEEQFLSANYIEKAIYAIEKLTYLTKKTKKILIEKYRAQILTVPFEPFVINPWPYMRKMEDLLKTKVTATTRRIMKRQNVPRKMYAEGIGLKVYKCYGWEAPKRNSNENREFEIRRRFAEKHASREAMQVLDQICADYEEKYLGGRKKSGEHYE